MRPIRRAVKLLLMEKIITKLDSGATYVLTDLEIDKMYFLFFGVRPYLKLADVNLWKGKFKEASR